MIHQSFSQWQSSPAQGAIASPIDLSQQLERISTQLQGIQATTEPYCESCPKLAESVADALTAVEQALAVLEEPQVYYDVAVEVESIKGKIHSSKSAF